MPMQLNRATPQAGTKKKTSSCHVMSYVKKIKRKRRKRRFSDVEPKRLFWVPRKVSLGRQVLDSPRGVVRFACCAPIVPGSVALKK